MMEEKGPVGSSGGGQDLFKEERRGRFWRLRRFLPGQWFNGVFGLVSLVCLVGFGFAWFLFLGGGPGSRYAEGFEDRVVKKVQDPVPADLGTVAGIFGEVLYMGSEGLPVIRHYETEEVREVTPVELEYASEAPFKQYEEQSVFFSPGPRGWGIWWEDREVIRSLELSFQLSRHGWRERQEVELAFLVRWISVGLGVVNDLDLERWEVGPSGRLKDIRLSLREQYSVVDVTGYWSAVPMAYSCDAQLEFDLHEGITPGCPDEVLVLLVNDVWLKAGLVVERFGAVAVYGLLLDGTSYGDFEESGFVEGLSGQLGDLMGEVSELSDALEALSFYSREVGLPITVSLFE